MAVYIFVLVAVAILGLLEYQHRYSMASSNHESNKKRINIYLILIVAVFLFVGGFRYQVGTDFLTYYQGFSCSWEVLLYKFCTLDEPLIFLITNLCRAIWNEGVLVIFVEHAITVLLVIKGIRDWEDKSITFPLLMYIVACSWTGSFNGIRQALAGAIIFAFSKQIGKWWWLRYTLVCFVAYLVHNTAIFILPILLLAHRKIDLKQIFIISGVAVLMPYFATVALSLTNSSLNTHYAQHSINILRVAISIVPMLMLLFTSRTFREENNFLANMIIFNALISFTTRNSALLYRFADYTDMYLMLFIPRLSSIFARNSKNIYRIIVFALYFLYFFTEVQSGNGNINNFQWVFSHIGE